jgi:hypothetical protein
MTDQMDHDEFQPISTTELNCYDRLKKLMSKQTDCLEGQRHSDRDE